MKKYMIIFSVIFLVLLATILGIWINKIAEKPDDDYSSGQTATGYSIDFYVNSQRVERQTYYRTINLGKEVFAELEENYVQNEISFYWLKNGEQFSPSDVEISDSTTFYLILDTEIDLSLGKTEEKPESLKISLQDICELGELTTVTIHMFDGENEPNSLQVLASEFEDVSPIAVGGTRMFCLLSATISLPEISVFKAQNMFWQISVEKTDGIRIFSDVEKIEGYVTGFSVVENL